MCGYGKNAIPSYALGRCSRLGGESEDLPKLFADGVIAVRLADWARMTETLTLYK